MVYRSTMILRASAMATGGSRSEDLPRLLTAEQAAESLRLTVPEGRELVVVRTDGRTNAEA